MQNSDPPSGADALPLCHFLGASGTQTQGIRTVAGLHKSLVTRPGENSKQEKLMYSHKKRKRINLPPCRQTDTIDNNCIRASIYKNNKWYKWSIGSKSFI